jgi:RNA polymerase sigma-70 factor (ECF subfamily)
MSRLRVAAKQIEPRSGAAVGNGGGDVSDAVLLDRTSGGDADAFRMLVDRHLTSMLAVARRMLRDDAEAEDVAQEAFLRLWRAGDTLELGSVGVRPWLRRVVSNLCIDRVRAGKRVTVVDEVPEEAEPAQQLSGIESRETSAKVDSALKSLPERQRLALTLFHYEGLSQIEIGEAMGISDEAVESLLARARRSLKGLLANEWRDLITQDDA